MLNAWLRSPQIAMLALTGLFLTACGTAEPDVAVADERFEGVFQIVDINVDGFDGPVQEAPLLEFDTRFGRLSVWPSCNTRFGSFTLGAEDAGDTSGPASFTLTGGTSKTCESLEDQETAILHAFKTANKWTALERGFVFTGPGVTMTTTGPLERSKPDSEPE